MRRWVLALFLASVWPTVSPGSEPGAVSIGGTPYVSVADVADRLSLKVVRLTTEPAILLKDGPRPIARLVDHSREIDLRGLRVFLGDAVVARGGTFYVSRADYDYRLLPSLRPGRCGPPPNPPRTIVLDPGHGGTDQGATNSRLGAIEKACTLDVALRLRKRLEQAGYTVILTRDADYDISKTLRSEVANRARADLFVSIHFNSLFPNTKTTGVEVLCFPPSSQRSADAWGAESKDNSEKKDSPVNAFNAWSSILASALHRRLLEALHDGDRGEKLEHLGVLRGLNCPGVLVEPAFVSSDVEGARLSTPAYRETIAEALFAGVQDYADEIKQLRALAPTPFGPSAPTTPRAVPTRPSS
ncbi:MAG TPA: N-acetylmuramoyl-L-alanine amidase [Opitutaceae bacterium]|jgi:N-acetylmuramoyl-L-alanine amidase